MALTRSEPGLKLNVGCGDCPMEGFVNIDLYVDNNGVDINGDFREMEFQDVAEIQLIHVLEHLPWGESLPTLSLMYSWLADGGKITVEVPDMVQILASGVRHPDWFQFVYGSQQHEGEFHKTGFSANELLDLMSRARFRDVKATVFASEHRMRTGLPCIEATAIA